MSSHRHECSVQSSKSILDPLVLQCCRMNDLRHNYAFLFGIRVCLTELKSQNPFEFCKLVTGTDSKVDSKVYFRLM